MSDRASVIEVYRKRAKHYDFTANLYYLIGFREMAYRRRAVKALGLQPGDTVIDIACGTGLNFTYLQEAVGPRGKIIGVDLTDAMLAQAQERISRKGWANVKLIHCDAVQYTFPSNVDGILSTLGISLIPEAGDIIRRGAKALSPGKRWAIMDFKLPNAPESWLPWLTTLMLPVVQPFGVTREVLYRRPWLINWAAMKASLSNTSWTELHIGTAYLAVGEREMNTPTTQINHYQHKETLDD